MLKTGTNLKIFYSELIHVTCMAHALNLVCETIRSKYKNVNILIQSAQKCGSNFYTKCHKMALSKSQICSILQHSIFEFFQKNMLRRFSEQFLPPICALKFVEVLLEGFSYVLSIMVVNLNIFNKI
jgi:hypothetical protein